MRANWNDRDQRWAKAYRERHYRGAATNWINQINNVDVPEDITVLERDPSPCFRCGTNGGCKHRPWELGA